MFLAYGVIGQVASQIPGYGYPYALVYLVSSAVGVGAFLMFRRVVHTIERDQEVIGASQTDRFAEVGAR